MIIAFIPTGLHSPFLCFQAWWGVEYFRGIWYSPDIRLFVNNLRSGDPCFVDADYLLDRQWVLNGVCEELVPMVPQFRSSAITVVDTLREVMHFDEDCSCPFPNQYMSGIQKAFLENASSIGFDLPIDVCGGGNTGGDCKFVFIRTTESGKHAIDANILLRRVRGFLLVVVDRRTIHTK